MKVFHDEGLVGYRAHCARRPTLERKGLWYCTQHDPERIARIAAEKQAKWEAKYAVERKHRRLEMAAPDLLAALKDILDGGYDVVLPDSLDERLTRLVARAEGDSHD